MLVLTRKLNEQIVIGSDITLTVVRVHGNTVRLGIEAPRHVRVLRGELPKNEAGAHDSDPIVGQSGFVMSTPAGIVGYEPGLVGDQGAAALART
jgi:carbon storage regulator CsrA